MLFAAGFDRWIFGHEMGVTSVIGCGLIVGSALWAALTKKEKEEKMPSDAEHGHGALEMEEGVPMLRDGRNSNEEEDAEESTGFLPGR